MSLSGRVHMWCVQYKKAIKAADTVLKTAPYHSETIAMKGLVLSHMGNKEEGMALVNQAIKLDMQQKAE